MGGRAKLQALVYDLFSSLQVGAGKRGLECVCVWGGGGGGAQELCKSRGGHPGLPCP